MRAWKALRQNCSGLGGSGLQRRSVQASPSPRAELRRRFGDAAASEEICVGERLEPLVEDGECVEPCRAEAGRDGRVGVVERDREQRRVLEREGPEDERHLDEALPGVC
jgi:hypothetical protein